MNSSAEKGIGVIEKGKLIFYPIVLIIYLLVVLGKVHFTWFIPFFVGWISFLFFHFRQTVQYYRPLGGWANLVTLSRWILMFLALGMAGLLSLYMIGLMLLISIILDAFDGYIARRKKQTSELGAILDIEADAFFTLGITVYLYYKLDLGVWVLIPGMIKYVYDLIVLIPLEKSVEFKRVGHERFMAIISIICFFVPFVLPTRYGIYALYIATTFTVLSFIMSFSYSVYKRTKNEG